MFRLQMPFQPYERSCGQASLLAFGDYKLERAYDLSDAHWCALIAFRSCRMRDTPTARWWTGRDSDENMRRTTHGVARQGRRTLFWSEKFTRRGAVLATADETAAPGWKYAFLFS
jgi:hypothetical protein